MADGADPTLISSYSVDGLQDINNLIKTESPDIITLNEAHKDVTYDQVKDIAEHLGYDYFVHDSTSPSHIDTSMQLGHGIISRYPIISHKTELFSNPNLSVEWEDGSIASSFDKGFTTCEIDVNGEVIAITTLHLVPFRRFNVAPGTHTFTKVLEDVSQSINTRAERWIIQGDFNIDSPTLREYFPSLFINLEEVTQGVPTTPKNRKYDHVLYRGLKYLSQKVDNTVLTDHYPVMTEFEVN